MRLNAFISYSTIDKRWAAETKKVLTKMQIDSFMAHEDLKVSEQWRDRILAELKKTDLFVCLLSKAYKDSEWCPQELGFIVARRKPLIIPLSIDDTIPFGFIAHIQSQPAEDPWQIEDRMTVALLHGRLRFGVRASLRQMQEVRGYRIAEAVTGRMSPFFGKLLPEEAMEFAALAVKNPAIWDAGLCAQDILPRFLAEWGERVPAETAEALRFQITERQRFRAPDRAPHSP